MTQTAKVSRHSMIEDAQGIAYGTVMASFGIVILTHLGLVTGQTAGLAVLISYATGWGFGPVFFAINLPFYLLGWLRMGPAFTIKTFLAVASLSGLSMVMPSWIGFEHLNPVFGAVLFGLASGSALLALFRHGASLGGIGILGLMIQDRWGFRAGWVQLGFDALLFTIALCLRDVPTVALSFMGAVVVNLVIAINHRRDRYIVA
ncbi:MAG: membrane protein [Rhodobacterales bacterium 65-51]|uniref:YitT family protein n=1 Tax=uncultured Gemmobacter sp. TaxID=1095917 RepID=UPI0009689016|nr:YitT family protein [uncultured Gemmobacter sp.]OJY26241.1 MAG: membrane protein [Rhodobacterales bacterium 65-51]